MEVTLKKKDVMTWAKAYLKAVEAKLKEQGKEDRVPEFKKGSTALFKFIIGKFDEFQTYTGRGGFSIDPPAALCFAF